MRVKANCKINLGLDVLRRREDGYHELATVIYPLRGLYDLLDIEPCEGREPRFENVGFEVDCPHSMSLEKSIF